MIGETSHGGIFPSTMGGRFDIVAFAAVVVHDDLLFLPGTLTGSEDDGSRILQHRDEVGDYDGLCEEVFRRAEEFRTLPFPYPVLHVVIATVTCPQGEVSALQSLRDIMRNVHVLDPWFPLVVGPPHTGLVLVLPQTVGNELLYLVVVSLHPQEIVVIR